MVLTVSRRLKAAQRAPHHTHHAILHFVAQPKSDQNRSREVSPPKAGRNISSKNPLLLNVMPATCDSKSSERAKPLCFTLFGELCAPCKHCLLTYPAFIIQSLVRKQPWLIIHLFYTANRRCASENWCILVARVHTHLTHTHTHRVSDSP